MAKGPVSGGTILEEVAKGVPHQPEFKTKMISAKGKSENRWHRNRSRRSSTERVAPWQDHGYFNRSTRSRSLCEDKAWIQKSSEEGKRHNHRRTSAKGGPPVGRCGLRQVPMTILHVLSKIIHDCYVPIRIINNLVGV